ncbi:MAG: hypothetical protein L3I99_05200, partial [Sulfurimonas sp.]|nr:hypothetical protein [Sulfurimonas sp.]
TSTMYCSDCHGAEDKLGGDPKGPHGSNLKYLLTGENQSWPTKPDGTTLYTSGDISKAGEADLFCKNCHNLSNSHRDIWNTMNFMDYACVTCHVAIPHGSPVSRLIGYDTFPSPYNYQGQFGGTLQFTRYIKNNIVDANDVAGFGCGGGSCHGGNSVPGYDPNIMP